LQLYTDVHSVVEHPTFRSIGRHFATELMPTTSKLARFIIRGCTSILLYFRKNEHQSL